jgi:predicted TIM-barrel fold metal-dependent hydrolase
MKNVFSAAALLHSAPLPTYMKYCGYEHYYPYDKRYQQVYDLCVESKAPVMIHTGDTFLKQGKLRFSHPINIDDVAVDNPDLKIVKCHLGNPLLNYSLYESRPSNIMT